MASCRHVEIDAPDGHAALELEYRLARLNAITVGHEGHWLVEIEADTDAVDEIEDEVGRWLKGIGEPEATVNIDGRTVCVPALRGSRAPDAKRRP